MTWNICSRPIPEKSDAVSAELRKYWTNTTFPYIQEECDRQEYEGSMIYDEYPDRLSLFRIADTISTILEQEAEKVSKDLIHVLVCNEIYKRRHGGRRGMIAFL